MFTYRTIFASINTILQDTKMRTLIYIFTALILTVFFMQDTPTAIAEEKTLASGLKINDTKVGEGEEAVSGKPVSVHYTGWRKI